MKRIINTVLTALLILTSSLVFGSGAPNVTDEFTKLNSLDMNGKLLAMSGGRCWQTCSDNDHFKLDCVTTCDEGESSGSSSGGGFIGPWGMPISLGIVGVLVGSFVDNGWWEYGSIGAGLGLVVDLAAGAFN